MIHKRRNWDQRVPHGRLKIEPRDIEILKALLDYWFLTSSQIQKKFFSSKSFADRRLRKPYDHGILERIIRPVTQGEQEFSTQSVLKGGKTDLWTSGHSKRQTRLVPERKYSKT